jgi:hypothetical protein
MKPGIPKYKKFYPPPPLVPTITHYQDVNEDKRLQEMVTKFFLRKTIKWINDYPEFKHLNDRLSDLKSEKGFKIIHKILKHFINQSYNINWYDVKAYYPLIKNYIKLSLSSS